MADTATEIVIASTVLSSSNTTITFSSIPNTYTDLRLVLIARSDALTTGAQINITYNSDSATNYSNTYIYGDGTTAGSGRNTSSTAIQEGMPGILYYGTYSLITLDVFSYAGSTFKTGLLSWSEDDNGAGYAWREVNLWRSTSAISTVTISAATGNFVAGTMATLYGIL